MFATCPKQLFQQAQESAPTKGASMNATDNSTAPADAGAQSTTETEVNAVINEALSVASPFIPGGPVAVKVAEMTGLAPAAVHLGFMFAHMFHHPKVQAAIAAANAPAPAPAPEPNAAEIARQQKVKEITEQLAALQSQLDKLKS